MTFSINDNYYIGSDSMRVLAMPIEMIAWFNENGMPTPLRFKLKNEDDSNNVIKVDKVIQIEKEKFAGNIMYVFKCQSIIDELEKRYEIKYELSSCKWMLYKM
jgi:hypothetical protein